MSQWMDEVIEALNQADVPACRAYCDEWQRELTGAQAVVELEKLDPQGLQVRVTVLTGSDQGAALCEATALKAASILTAMGEVYLTGPCKYDAHSDLFSLQITVKKVQSAE